MGIGDEIMVTGEVRKMRLSSTKAQRFAIIDGRTVPIRIRTHDIWRGNPYIVQPGEPFDSYIENRGGMRPYIVAKTGGCWVWQAYTPTPGEIFLTAEELETGVGLEDAVIIQPYIKHGASVNKQWGVGVERWQELVRANPGTRWVQVGDGGPAVPGVAEYRFTKDFRHACGALAGARAAVLLEGGLHHAAAALGKPAVVIFGGFISPKCTGYNTQQSLFVDSAQYPLGCGMRHYCRHCDAAMRGITPQHVYRALERALAK